VIEAEKATFPIAWMCALLGVPRSSFYHWRDRVAAETATAARRRVLAGHVARAFHAGRGTYGCRRVTAQLNREGHPCSVGLVADLMRELGLKACQPRAYRRTTVPGEQPIHSPELIERDFTAEQPGTRLVGDITYLKTGEGWLYLATVIDLATRMVIGWQLAGHMRTNLVVDALAMAIRHGRVRPCAIFHSDRGAQYTSTIFAEFCRVNRVRTSLGRTGVCWDNAAAESFFAALKNEMYHRTNFATRARARFAVADYIETSHQRFLSSGGGLAECLDRVVESAGGEAVMQFAEHEVEQAA
jgi:putative transposase